MNRRQYFEFFLCYNIVRIHTSYKNGNILKTKFNLNINKTSDIYFLSSIFCVYFILMPFVSERSVPNKQTKRTTATLKVAFQAK